MKSDTSKKLLIAIPAVLLVVFIGNMLINGVSTSSGEIQYKENCGQCHGEEGEGFQELIPPLANTDWVVNNYVRIPCIVKHGLEGEIYVNGKMYNQPMLPVENVSDIEMLNITNYILNELNDHGKYLTMEDIARWDSLCY